MSVTEELTATLRAQEHGHQPIVFEPGAASRLGGHSDKGLCGTLRADMGDNQLAVVVENHPTDSRVTLDTSGKVQTLTSRMGTGGGNVPLTLEIRSGCDGGGKSALVQDDMSATLSCNNEQTLFMPKTYGICSKDSNAMKSANPNSGIYEADTSRTLDKNGGNPACKAINSASSRARRPLPSRNGWIRISSAWTSASAVAGGPVITHQTGRAAGQRPVFEFAHQARDQRRMSELEPALADVDAAVLARPVVDWPQPQAVQGSDVGSAEAMLGAVVLDRGVLRDQQSL